MSKQPNKKILLLNGPNLNLLGNREPDIYGSTSLINLEKSLKEKAAAYAITLETQQSNREYELIEAIHAAKADDIASIIINPAAFTHTSIALRDAFLGTGIPFIEIHISNIYARESFRHISYLSDIASGIIIGHGLLGYELALMSAIHIVHSEDNQPLM